MACRITLLLDTDSTPEASRALARAEAEMQRLASIMTRFDASSELSRLNATGSATCSSELFAVIERAVAAHAHSAGAFDPTVHDSMLRAGYDRTFGLLEAAALDDATPTDSTRSSQAWLEAEHHLTPLPIRLDPITRTVSLLNGVRLDLGGIAKGWIADRVCEQLSATAPALVNAGGDIACSARADGEPWMIEVERDTIDIAARRSATADPIALALDVGGIATSGVDRRRWRDNNGHVQHHIIDPHTGAPADTDVLVVTVIADSCVSAEVLATQLLLAGFDAACAQAHSQQLAAIITRHDGTLVMTGPLQ